MGPMHPRQVERMAARIAAKSSRAFREDVDRLREDAGTSVPDLARAAGIDSSYLYRVIAGKSEPSDAVRARLAVALGADLSMRLYPNTGPLVRDRHQARMTEVLLAELHPRWRPFAEVRVLRPSRGWIDLVLHDAAATVAVATELQSELRRLEQLVRWAAEKAASLPSWDGWARLTPAPSVSQLLVVRRTRATRAVAADFAHQLRLAFPAHPDDALAALTSAAVPWPGPAIVWVEITAAGARFLPGR
jgi:transcriptional regulator with XRE-family HTH domain